MSDDAGKRPLTDDHLRVDQDVATPIKHELDVSLLRLGDVENANKFVNVQHVFSTPLSRDDYSLITAAISCGRILGGGGDFERAEAVQRKVVASYEHINAEQHDDALSAKIDLAATLRERGKLEEAMDFQENILDLVRGKFGVSHDTTLEAMFDLGHTYIQRGKHAEAIVMLCEGITIGQRVWDNENPGTGHFEHELAVALRSCGEYRQALDLIPGAVDNLSRCLGPRHPDTLTAMSTMGVLYKDLGLLGDAAAKFEDVLRRSEEAFPDGHIHILRSRSNLANVRARQGRLAESVEIHRDVLKAMRTQLGDAHPDTLTAMAHLGETLRWIGDTAEAAAWYGLVFSKMSETFDKNAPEMIEALSDYANSLLDRGKTIEAQEKLAEVLIWNEEKFGHDHPHTVIPRNNLAAAYHEEGRLEVAVKMLMMSYHILDQSPDSSLENTIIVGSNLVSALFELGIERRSMDSLTRATQLQHALVEMSRSSLDIWHQLTVRVMRNCTYMMEMLENSEDAQHMTALLAANVTSSPL